MTVWEVVMLTARGDMYVHYPAARSALGAKLRTRACYVRNWGCNGIDRPKYAARRIDFADAHAAASRGQGSVSCLQPVGKKGGRS